MADNDALVRELERQSARALEHCENAPYVPVPVSTVQGILAALRTPQPEAAQGVVERAGFAPCPTCGQYSHSLTEGQLSDALMHFQSMFDHRRDGRPTQFNFDAKTRDAAQVLMSAAIAAMRQENK